MISTRSVIVIGAGGHARVVADALLCAGANVLGFTDTDASLWGRTLVGLPVLGSDDVLARYAPGTVVLANGLGIIDARSATLRRRVQEELASSGWTFTGVRHPSSIVSPQAQLAVDAQVLAGAVVQTGASVGAGTIINTRAVIEHDVTLGDWSHVAPGAVVCGDVKIGGSTHIGAGATVSQGLRVGSRCLIGLGAAVVSNQTDDACAVGVPARPFKSKQ